MKAKQTLWQHDIPNSLHFPVCHWSSTAEITVKVCNIVSRTMAFGWEKKPRKIMEMLKGLEILTNFPTASLQPQGYRILFPGYRHRQQQPVGLFLNKTKPKTKKKVFWSFKLPCAHLWQKKLENSTYNLHCNCLEVPTSCYGYFFLLFIGCVREANSEINLRLPLTLNLLLLSLSGI